MRQIPSNHRNNHNKTEIIADSQTASGPCITNAARLRITWLKSSMFWGLLPVPGVAEVETLVPLLEEVGATD
jgi:hypothetical protein